MKTLTIEEAIETCKTKDNIRINYIYTDCCDCCHKSCEADDWEYSYDGFADIEEFQKFQDEYAGVEIYEKVEQVDENEFNYYVDRRNNYDEIILCAECDQMINELELETPDYHTIGDSYSSFEYTCTDNEVIESRKEDKRKYVEKWSQEYLENLEV